MNEQEFNIWEGVYETWEQAQATDDAFSSKIWVEKTIAINPINNKLIFFIFIIYLKVVLIDLLFFLNNHSHFHHQIK